MADARIHLIAEAGTNHNGSVATGKALIDAGAAAGADSVKFQMIFPEGLYLPQVFEDGRYVESEVYQRRCRTALSPDDYRELAAHCRSRGVGFSASVFDQQGIDLLDELDADYIKTASCDLNNLPLLRRIAETGRRMVVSTGMSTLIEIEQAVRAITDTGNADIVLMHCVSVYPCPTEAMNLTFIDTLKSAFGFEVGLSDHTEASLAAAVAVSKGVRWIEKHITLDRAAEGFDHAYAMEPEAFCAYARDLAAVSNACRPGGVKVGDTEAQVRRRARRGLYAARDINAGEPIEEADVLIVRPEGPLPPAALPQVASTAARRFIHRYEALDWDMLIPTSAGSVATASLHA